MKKKKIVSTQSKKLSLNPLNFEEALSALLKVKPESKQKRKRKNPKT